MASRLIAQVGKRGTYIEVVDNRRGENRRRTTGRVRVSRGFGVWRFFITFGCPSKRHKERKEFKILKVGKKEKTVWVKCQSFREGKRNGSARGIKGP